MPRQSRRTRRHLSLQVLDDRRVLAAIVGSVFNDANDSFRRDLDETGLAGRLVYVDQNENARIDQGERYALTGNDGGFSIDGMADGDYAVRVYNGTSSQVQTSGLSAAMLHDVVLRNDVVGGAAAIPLDGGTGSARTAAAVLASGNSLQTLASDGTLGAEWNLGGTISQVTRMADGSLLVLGEQAGESRVWWVDDTLSSATAVYDAGSGLVLTSLATDDIGRGVALAGSVGGQSELWTFEASSESMDGFLAEATGVMVPERSVVTGDSTPRSGDGPTRSVLSHTELVDDGNGGTTQALAISFWSFVGQTPLAAPILVSGATEVVAFHDEAGLLVLRSGDDLTVHDVDGNLATLYTISDTAAVAAIDGARGLVVTLSPRSFGSTGSSEDAGLRLLDSETGSVVADLAIDFSALGEIAAVSLDANLSSVLVTGVSGVAQVTLRRPAAAWASIAGGDSAPVAFGMRLIGNNSAPNFAIPPVIEAVEDVVLLSPAPGVAAGAVDSDAGDQYVVLQSGAASSGIATVNLDGQILYIPVADFEGPATVSVILHDGRDAVETMVVINVLPVPDAPLSVSAVIDPVPENILPSDPNGVFNAIGIINIVDVDAVNNFDIEILGGDRLPDERFQIINGQIVFVGPGRLDFESEWEIPLIFTVTDPDTGTTIESATTISVQDSDDPVTDIVWSNGVTNKSVRENSPGEIIGSLTAVDEDFDQIHAWSVDDERFEVVSDELKLKDNVSLDREASETVTIQITATFGGNSFTKPFVIRVIDSPEVPINFLMSNSSVLELKPGAVVGDLSIAGNPAANGHALTVDDSRFIFEGSTLRLADEVFLERTPGLDDEILIEITATPDFAGAAGVTTQFVVSVLENDKPFHNSVNPEDVNGNGSVSSLDALIIINYLNAFGPGAVGEGDPAMGYDVNNDGMVTSLDALLVINEMNASTSGGGGTVGNEPDGNSGGEPSGEPIESSDGETPASEITDAGSDPDRDANSTDSNRVAVAPQGELPTPPRDRRGSPRDEAFASLVDTLAGKDDAATDSQFDSQWDSQWSASPVGQSRRIETAVRSVSIRGREGDALEESADEVFGERLGHEFGASGSDLVG